MTYGGGGGGVRILPYDIISLGNAKPDFGVTAFLTPEIQERLSDRKIREKFGAFKLTREGFLIEHLRPEFYSSCVFYTE